MTINFQIYFNINPLIKYRAWENFGGRKFWRINGSKVFGEEKFGESVGSLLKTLAFINIGGENFGELPIVCQIRQNFPPPKFSHVRYINCPNKLSDNSFLWLLFDHFYRVIISTGLVIAF